MELTQAYGTAHFIIVFELLIAALLCSYTALSVMLKHSSAPRRLFDGVVERESVSRVFFSLFLILLFYSQWLSGGKEIAAVGFAMPGSLLTRSLEIDASFWFRRFLEPSIWFFILCLFVSYFDAQTKRAARWYQAASFFLVLLLCFECFMLTNAGELLEQRHSTMVRYLHLLLGQLVLLPLLLGLLFDRARQKYATSLASAYGFSLCVLLLLTVPSVFLFRSLEARSAQAASPLKAGAHYYSWFPSNWAGGTVGQRTVPPVLPELGEYRSSDASVFEQHVSWAKEAGIDFFVFDWWPKRPWIGKRIFTHVVRKQRAVGMDFSILYESLDLKEDGDKTFPGEESNVAFMTEKRSYRLRKHWEYLAKHYFHRENYLRINGKPVLFVYASRHLVGPVAKAIRDARNHVLEVTGESLFIVGDEVFFNVLKYSHEHGLLLLPEGVPNWDRLSAFDALTSYNPYDSARKEHGGVQGAEQFLADVSELYAHYKRVGVTVGIRFIPGVLPGYNDRGVRPKEEHFVVPRRLSDGSSFFARNLEAWGKPFFDTTAPMFTVTTWNEWNEGTQIEPAKASENTRIDDSETSDLYTQGEEYWGYEKEFLEILSQFLEQERASQP